MRPALALALLAACGGTVAPAKPVAKKPVVVPAKPRGPFAVDAAGRWKPTAIARARLTTGAGAPELVAFDASPELTALAVRHAAPLLLDGAELAPAGLTVVVFDAAGKKRWHRSLDLHIQSLRAGATSVAYGGRGATAATFVIDTGGERPHVNPLRDVPGHGTITAVYPLPDGQVLFASRWEATGKRVVEPFQGAIGRSSEHDTATQFFGGDHVFEAERIEPGPDDWWFVLGSYRGAFGGGGKAAPPAVGRTGFVAGVDDESQLAWIIGLPENLEADDVHVLAGFSDDTGLHMLVSGTGARLRLSHMHMTTQLQTGGLCTHLSAAPGSQLRSADLEGGLVAAVGRFDDLALGATGTKTAAEGAFLDRQCRLLAAFDVDGEARGVRFSGPDVVLAVENQGALELRWAKPCEACGSRADPHPPAQDLPRAAGASEEQAWAGVGWTVGKRNFAHVVHIADGWRGRHADPGQPPPAGAPAAASDARGQVIQRGEGLVERGDHRAAVQVTLLGLLGQRTGQQRLQRRRDPRLRAHHAGQGGRRRAHVLAHQLDRVLGLERALAGEHLEEDRAHRVEVGAAVDRLAQRLLGRHVRRRAEHHAARGQLHVAEGVGGVADELDHAEVEQLDVLVLLPGLAAQGQHDVLRLEIAVDQAARVGVAERLDDLAGQDERAAHAQRALAERVAQRATAHQLHDHEHPALVLAEVEHLDDVGVIEQVRRHRLALEAGHHVVEVGETGQDGLQGHRPAGRLVHRLEDLAGPAVAQLARQAVAAGDHLPGHELTLGDGGHGMSSLHRR
jgi:hypothetical protein